MKSFDNHVENGVKEVLYEFRRVGSFVRVCAIDPETRTEVIMVGDPKQGLEVLKRIATRKLIYVMRKKGIKIYKGKHRAIRASEFKISC